MKTQDQLMEEAEQAEELNQRPFGKRTKITPEKRMEREVPDFSGFQDGTYKTKTESVEKQKKLVDIDHSGIMGEDPKRFTNA
ncbi:MAG: hypothetical protein JRF50_16000 [Deltaproteobacteria bacterium]|nr:hypothetical protein [Deltaproteobacteria bacterium]